MWAPWQQLCISKFKTSLRSIPYANWTQPKQLNNSFWQDHPWSVALGCISSFMACLSPLRLCPFHYLLLSEWQIRFLGSALGFSFASHSFTCRPFFQLLACKRMCTCISSLTTSRLLSLFPSSTLHWKITHTHLLWVCGGMIISSRYWNHKVTHYLVLYQPYDEYYSLHWTTHPGLVESCQEYDFRIPDPWCVQYLDRRGWII